MQNFGEAYRFKSTRLWRKLERRLLKKKEPAVLPAPNLSPNFSCLVSLIFQKVRDGSD
jgi:hypothetical protein